MYKLLNDQIMYRYYGIIICPENVQYQMLEVHPHGLIQDLDKL